MDSTSAERPFLRPTDLEQHLSCSRATVLRLISDGSLPGSIRIGFQWRIPRTALLAYLSRPPDTAPPSPEELDQLAQLGTADLPCKLTMTLDELARRWWVSRDTVERLIATGRLACATVRSRPRVSVKEVKRFESAARQTDD